jgi:hypothetical protein
MTLWSGKHGKMIKNGVTVAQVQDFKIDIALALHDGTALMSDWKNAGAGVSDWKGTCTLFFDPGITEHAAILAAIVPASGGGVMLTDITFEIDGLGGHKTFSGNLWINGLSPSVPVGDLVKAAVSFTGDGQLTFTA